MTTRDERDFHPPPNLADVKTTITSSQPREIMSDKRRASSTLAADARKKAKGEIKPSQLSLFLAEVVDKIKKEETESYENDGTTRLLAGEFLELPSKRYYPHYYEEIQKPVSFKEIDAKIATNGYVNIDQFEKDLKQMANNAAAFNDKDSVIAQDALKIAKLGVADARKYTGEQEEVNDDDLKDEILELFSDAAIDILNDLATFKYKAKRTLPCEPFMVEPDRDLYPDYYEVIETPMSIAILEKMVNNREVKNFDDLESKLQIMIDNAKHYNADGSPIYVDAILVEKAIPQKVEKGRKAFGEENLATLHKFFKPKQKLKLTLNKPEATEEAEEKKPEEPLTVLPPNENPLRAPGRAPLVRLLTVHSTLPIRQQLKQIPESQQDPFQINIPASPTHALQNHTFALPAYHSTISVDAELDNSLYERPYNLQLTLNSARIQPIYLPSSAWGSQKDLQGRYELRLAPGLNRVDVSVDAAPANAPPQRTAHAQFEEHERFTLWVHLM
ncbi:YALI0E32307p [Yarrowia lipolytica CLIB122]|jgi:chromatin structure-remodeling complex subunit RSC4|uniref:YALI0E32307p n=3 Tax=Yarrowia lipolytica TaxID=4952 RepID=Q6C3T3_YARLI|nr:YALI0E32307p [Yarrowia lipolytica CLIB122]AOW06286.1 hypothetical protein YALI1_E38243g [Yarrowia lipolytica]KAJ8057658.1 Bromodomain-containing protein [Yarrowia lipolytica]QNQ00873.1 Protein polybromo-1 [Yarrowia lipolytica]CAG80283.1 YALI0E32307p [Yarrowia lipolytica CLIB122]SEI31828.1 YALIA101S02e03048g1_1 [Yarrowia lipolytica]|eukprot:XP_504679.1 YALI0E32307p [Yarrowia lipolytica CLIB122]